MRKSLLGLDSELALYMATKLVLHQEVRSMIQFYNITWKIQLPW